MNSTVRRMLTLLTFVVCGVSAFSQQVNPARDINWTRLAGSGPPDPADCTTNYGQPYTDQTNQVAYFCGVGGWFSFSTGGGVVASASLTTNTVPKSTGTNSIGDSAVIDDGTNVQSSEPLNAPSFVGNDTSHNGFLSLTSEGTMPSAPGSSTVQITVPNAGMVAYRLVLPATGPTAGNGVLVCTPPSSSTVTCAWESDVVATGSAFSVSGCTASTPVGGQNTGKFKSGTSGTCTVTVTMGDAQSAPHGWACGGLTDLTTNSDSSSWQQTATSTTTATLSGTTVTNDLISFTCRPY